MGKVEKGNFVPVNRLKKRLRGQTGRKKQKKREKCEDANMQSEIQETQERKQVKV